ncbi:hypothetical protein [Streptomyces sp. NRRL S-1448]|uniref:hypothetical protein n=1 Tax=Streptomyces sp. NRRL S-1448 TaxID=1463883 RepID=UPI0004BE8B34|nr:hypothetical protein [Streptomyces sp. NRRL S-1448]
MGEQFKTDVDQLGQFLTTLEGCVRELNEARSALAHVRADQIGTGRLDEACDGFQERWRYGSEQTKKMVDAISEGVKATKQNYQEIEEALAKTLTQIAQKTASGGGQK